MTPRLVTKAQWLSNFSRFPRTTRTTRRVQLERNGTLLLTFLIFGVTFGGLLARTGESSTREAVTLLIPLTFVWLPAQLLLIQNRRNKPAWRMGATITVCIVCAGVALGYWVVGTIVFTLRKPVRTVFRLRSHTNMRSVVTLASAFYGSFNAPTSTWIQMLVCVMVLVSVLWPQDRRITLGVIFCVLCSVANFATLRGSSEGSLWAVSLVLCALLLTPVRFVKRRTQLS